MAATKSAAKATPRATKTKTSTPSKTPLAKSKGAGNSSILSFFKKAEDSLFVAGVERGAPQSALLPEEEGLYDDDDEGPPKEDARFNEVQGSVKRRKLSSEPEEIQGTATIHPQPPAQSRKASRKGPFLDDSDSEDEDTAPTGAETSKPLIGEPSKDHDPQDTVKPEAPPDDDRSILNIITHATEAASDTPELKQEPSTEDLFGDFADANFPDDDDYEGEEFRERKFMEEQARLEAEEAGDYSCDDGVEIPTVQDDAMAACCPICNASLAGITADEATVHVNACLDGKPIPVPTPASRPRPPPALLKSETSNGFAQVEAPEISRRFARAAMPRPGQSNPITLGGEGGAGPGLAKPNSAFAKLMSGHAEDEAWATAAAAEHSARGKPAYQRTCPFYKIMPGFFICVDAFRYGAVQGCNAYFLSHFHSDHYVGLTANWTHGPIYCSKVTGSLVKSQLRTAEKWVVELEFDVKTEVPGTEGVFVTMIPANHCPGSSLFLFEKTTPGSRDPRANNGKGPRTQRILHCGDFRACRMHMEHPLLRPETVDAVSGRTRQQKIDVCYLDTTYLNPRYSFPPQEDVSGSCAQLCAELDEALRDGREAEWDKILRRREGSGAADNETMSKFFAPVVDGTKPKKEKQEPPPAHDAFSALTGPAQQQRNRNRLLVVCGTYSIGKERICKSIALALRTKIFAPPAKRRVVAQLGDPELAALMTADPARAQVHMQMLMELRAETLAEYLESYRPHFGRVVGFRPSGWNYRPTMANNSSVGGGGSGKKAGGAAGGQGPQAAAAAAAVVGANLPPSSVPTASILHGPGWRTRFGARDLVPQRGSTREALCFGVPYSEHSSFRELALFVMGLRIERVVPTVNVGSEPSRRRMKGWLDRWGSERRRGGVVRVLVDEEDRGDDGDGDGDMEDEGKQKSRERDEVKLWDGKDGRGGGVYW
ncbi:uncharacterized protein E0L32_009744 [Thyridium curvatum]|uniref:DNA repair metallo-beta-lactamase domain-containing protein n=1 Tax=Thyridium curvatum TaxID=1093900 RepID=A0A507AQM4_9PEZI|nr:uncharacterized protein E0L32_009744 [Thyridium curvatum]TPX08804.1 hypothetical protein E0L32_009744 [Thyridium curvatum]